MTQSDLYWADILIWSEQQAALLRRLAAGECVTDQIDWENVIDEIDSVGRGQLLAVESALVQALRYILKAQAWPEHRDAPSWRAEAEVFRADAERRFAPSMRERLDLAKIYRRAVCATPTAVDGKPPQPLQQTCPMTLDDLLGEP